MTSPSPLRPGTDPAGMPSRPGNPGESGNAPPLGAVTLADLIADSGPLPPDAALECVQRLAERLSGLPSFSCTDLMPSDVLIDDDGGVWLRPTLARASVLADGRPPSGMSRLGCLLAFLATGDGRFVESDGAPDVASLPAPLSQVAGRLFSGNGACYRSYSELAREAANLRGMTAASSFDASAGPNVAEIGRAAADVEIDSPSAALSEPVDAPEASESSSGAKLGLMIAAAVVVGAIVAYAVSLWL